MPATTQNFVDIPNKNRNCIRKPNTKYSPYVHNIIDYLLISLNWLLTLANFRLDKPVIM